MGALSMTEEKVYTVEEIATILRVTSRTVRTMIAKKEIEAFKVRSEYRIRQSALDRLMRRKDESQNA